MNKILILLLVIPLSSSSAEERIFSPTGEYAISKPKPPSLPAKPSFSSYNPWFENGRQTSDSHLIKNHGCDPKLVYSLTPEEKNRLHGKMHGERPTFYRPSSACPNGRCPIR